MDSSSS